MKEALRKQMEELRGQHLQELGMVRERLEGDIKVLKATIEEQKLRA